MASGGFGNLGNLGSVIPQSGLGTASSFSPNLSGWNTPTFSTSDMGMSPAQNWWTNTPEGRAAGGQQGMNTTLVNNISSNMGNYAGLVNAMNQNNVSQADIARAANIPIGDVYTYMNRPGYTPYTPTSTVTIPATDETPATTATVQRQWQQQIYRPQYQNYSNTNPMSVSQYGRLQTSAPSANVSDWFGKYATGFSPSQDALDFWGNKVSTLGVDAAFDQFLNPSDTNAPRLPTMRNDVDWQATKMDPYLATQTVLNPYMAAIPNGTQFTPTFQTPFSYAGGMGTASAGGNYGGNYGGYPAMTGNAAMYAQPTPTSAPTTPIVSRSYAARGTPAIVAHRASGGITGLLDK